LFAAGLFRRSFTPLGGAAAELIDKQAMFGGHERRNDEMQRGRDQRDNH
jgi:hypothetical protein